MQAHRIRLVSNAFLVTEPDLRSIVAEMAGEVPILAFKVKCSDGIERSSRDIDELCKFENDRARRIERLTILGIDESGEKWLRLELSCSGYSNVAIALELDDCEYERVAKRLEHRIDGLRPWYWFLVDNGWRGELCIMVPAMLISYAIGRAVWSTLALLSGGEAVASVGLVAAALGVQIVLSIPIYLLIGRMSAYVFPIGVFAIGEGVRDCEHGDKVRMSCILALLVSVIGGILVGWIMV